MYYDFLIPIFGIVFGTSLVGLIIWKTVDLIKTWITRNNSSYDAEKFDRLAKAFIQHKKDTDRRLQNIEAILTDDDSVRTSLPKSSENKKSSAGSIEIESDHSVKDHEESGELNNMLKKEKNR